MPTEQPAPVEFPLPPGTNKVRLVVQLPPGGRASVDVQAEDKPGVWYGIGQADFDGPPQTLTPGPAEQGDAARQWADLMAFLAGPLAALRAHWEMVTLVSALAIYLLVRLIALPSFPIYFFSDEAIQTVLAADLVRDGMKGYSGEFLPTYFPNAGQYNLSVSVYAQVIPYLIFGKTIWATRGVSAVLSLLAALACGLTLREAFGLRRAWLGVLLLSATPVWFLHSRTAFETVIAVSFYAAFLCAYLIYRKGRVKWLYAAVAAAALGFYSYSPAQVVIGITAVLLFFSDLRYHWSQRRVVLPALAAALVLAIPYFRHQSLHPGAIEAHLAILDSYLVAPLTFQEKLAKAFTIYFQGIDPTYWFLPNTRDLVRHIMGRWGHIMFWTAPFYILGLGLALWKARKPEYRALLLALLASPLGAVPVGTGITRVLFVVIPTILLTALGLDAVIEFAGRRRAWLRPAAGGLSLAVLGLASPLLLSSALNAGPTWFHDYGMGGIQYGASQVFGAIQRELWAKPQQPIVISPTWANATDVLARFFFPDPLPFAISSIHSYTDSYNPFPPETLFIFPAEEFQSIPRDMFSRVDVERILPFPDGSPGFYFVRMEYIPNLEEAMAQKRAEQAKPIEGSVTINGVEVPALYSRLDMGSLGDLFDGNLDTITRTEIANPYILELRFPEPVAMSGLTARVGGTATTFTVQATVAGETEPRSASQVLDNSDFPRDAEVDFGSELQVETLRIEVLNTLDGPEAHVHLWEISFK